MTSTQSIVQHAPDGRNKLLMNYEIRMQKERSFDLNQNFAAKPNLYQWALRGFAGNADRLLFYSSLKGCRSELQRRDIKEPEAINRDVENIPLPPAGKKPLRAFSPN